MSKSQAALFDELRHLLLQDEWQEHKEKLNQLISDLEDTGKRVDELAGILPKAISKNVEGDSTELQKSLLPVTQQQIKTLVQNDRKWFANLLTPVMMPLVRSAIANAIEDVLQRINNLFAGQTSIWNIIKWRLQSIFTGASYAELVLKDTLEYRVDQVYLLQADTGLLIDHVTNQSVKVDPDAVSSMLVALEDFMQDSFSDQDKTLDSIRIGQQTAWLFNRDKIGLACIFSGIPEGLLRNNIQDEFDELYDDNFDLLQDFDSNREPLKEGVRPYLDRILSFKKNKYRPVSKVPSYIALSLLSILLLSYVGYRYWSHHKMEYFIDSVTQKTGWQLINADINGPSIFNWKTDLDASFLIDSLASNFDSERDQLPEHMQDNLSITTLKQLGFAPELLKKRVEMLGVEVLSFDQQHFKLKSDSASALAEAESLLSFLNFSVKSELSFPELRKPFFAYFERFDVLEIESQQALDNWLTTLSSTLCQQSARCTFVITPSNDELGSPEANHKVRDLRYNQVKTKIETVFADSSILYNTEHTKSYSTHISNDAKNINPSLRNVKIELLIQ